MIIRSKKIKKLNKKDLKNPQKYWNVQLQQVIIFKTFVKAHFLTEVYLL